MEFHLPDLGEGLPDVNLVNWLVKKGDHVEQDQAIVSVETAKAVVEIPAPVAGKITSTYGMVGDRVRIGDLLVSIEQTSTVKAIPKARKLARTHGIDIEHIKPSDGVSIKTHDVEAFIKQSSKPFGSNLSMASILSKAQQEVALATVMQDAILHNKPSDITSKIILAMIESCQKHPLFNAHYNPTTKQLETQLMIDIGIVIDINQNNQSYIPTISVNQDETVTVEDIRNSIENLKNKASNHAFEAEDLKQPSIILSNYGSLGGRYATPMVRPPCLATLGMGRIYSQANFDDKGDLQQYHHLPLSLSFDHRYITGANALLYLNDIIKQLT